MPFDEPTPCEWGDCRCDCIAVEIRPRGGPVPLIEVGGINYRPWHDPASCCPGIFILNANQNSGLCACEISGTLKWIDAGKDPNTRFPDDSDIIDVTINAYLFGTKSVYMEMTAGDVTFSGMDGTQWFCLPDCMIHVGGGYTPSTGGSPVKDGPGEQANDPGTTMLDVDNPHNHSIGLVFRNDSTCCYAECELHRILFCEGSGDLDPKCDGCQSGADYVAGCPNTSKKDPTQGDEQHCDYLKYEGSDKCLQRIPSIVSDLRPSALFDLTDCYPTPCEAFVNGDQSGGMENPSAWWEPQGDTWNTDWSDECAECVKSGGVVWSFEFTNPEAYDLPDDTKYYKCVTDGSVPGSSDFPGMEFCFDNDCSWNLFGSTDAWKIRRWRHVPGASGLGGIISQGEVCSQVGFYPDTWTECSCANTIYLDDNKLPPLSLCDCFDYFSAAGGNGPDWCTSNPDGLPRATQAEVDDCVDLNGWTGAYFTQMAIEYKHISDVTYNDPSPDPSIYDGVKVCEDTQLVLETDEDWRLCVWGIPASVPGSYDIVECPICGMGDCPETGYSTYSEDFYGDTCSDAVDLAQSRRLFVMNKQSSHLYAPQCYWDYPKADMCDWAIHDCVLNTDPGHTEKYKVTLTYCSLCEGGCQFVCEDGVWSGTGSYTEYSGLTGIDCDDVVGNAKTLRNHWRNDLGKCELDDIGEFWLIKTGGGYSQHETNMYYDICMCKFGHSMDDDEKRCRCISYLDKTDFNCWVSPCIVANDSECHCVSHEALCHKCAANPADPDCVGAHYITEAQITNCMSNDDWGAGLCYQDFISGNNECSLLDSYADIITDCLYWDSVPELDHRIKLTGELYVHCGDPDTTGLMRVCRWCKGMICDTREYDDDSASCRYLYKKVYEKCTPQPNHHDNRNFLPVGYCTNQDVNNYLDDALCYSAYYHWQDHQNQVGLTKCYQTDCDKWCGKHWDEGGYIIGANQPAPSPGYYKSVGVSFVLCAGFGGDCVQHWGTMEECLNSPQDKINKCWTFWRAWMDGEYQAMRQLFFQEQPGAILCNEHTPSPDINDMWCCRNPHGDYYINFHDNTWTFCFYTN